MKPTNVKGFLRNIILLVNLLAVIALLGAYSSVYMAPDKFWIPAFLGLAYPFILAANILFVAFWMVVKFRYSLLSLVFILAGWGFVGRYFQTAGNTTEQKDIRILSYNVRHFIHKGVKNRKQTAEDVVALLKEQNADIICLQEARLREKKVFNLSETVKQLESINHYQFASSSTTLGLVTMTRYPIVKMGEIRFEHTSNISIYTDVLIDTDTVRIFNLHLQSYRINPKNYSLIESIDLQEEESRRAVKKVASQLKRGFELRATQVRELHEYLDNSPYPVIVCGDFNDTAVSFAYKNLTENLEDAFVNSGKGVGRTYAGKLPAFRIDYILYSDFFDSYNYETLKCSYSDHLPIACDLIRRD